MFSSICEVGLPSPGIFNRSAGLDGRRDDKCLLLFSSSVVLPCHKKSKTSCMLNFCHAIFKRFYSTPHFLQRAKSIQRRIDVDFSTLFRHLIKIVEISTRRWFNDLSSIHAVAKYLSVVHKQSKVMVNASKGHSLSTWLRTYPVAWSMHLS